MRVFPLEGRQEKRIILSYTQRLERLGDRVEYRFPGGHSMAEVGQWSLPRPRQSLEGLPLGGGFLRVRGVVERKGPAARRGG